MVKGVDSKFIARVNNFIQALPLHLDPSDREKNNNGGYIDFTEAYDWHQSTTRFSAT